MMFWRSAIALQLSTSSSKMFNYIFQVDSSAHPFFDAMRDPKVCLPSGQPLPPLFNFSAAGEFSIHLTMSLFRCTRLKTHLELSRT